LRYARSVIAEAASNASPFADPTSNASPFRHPDEASNASGRKDLGQLRASEAGSVSEIAQRSFADTIAQACGFSSDGATQTWNLA
jgi:hypothetical protein